MKRITFTFFLLSFFIGEALASQMTVNLPYRGSYIVEIDGRTYQGARQVTITNLRPGLHSVRVFQNRPAYRRPVYGRGHRAGYGRIAHKVVTYDGSVNVRPGTLITASVGPRGYFAVSRVEAIHRRRGPAHHQPRRGPVHQPTKRGPVHNTPSRAVCSDVHFQSFMNSLNYQTFESTKEKIAEQFILNNAMSTAQVRQMLSAFTFESTKLDMAKLAYDSVVDPHNYHTLYNCFTFNSSVDELVAFTSGY